MHTFSPVRKYDILFICRKLSRRNGTGPPTRLNVGEAISLPLQAIEKEIARRAADCRPYNQVPTFYVIARSEATWQSPAKGQKTVPYTGFTLTLKNRTAIAVRSICWHYLSSRAVARQVLSAQMCLTSVFGMGTGGPTSQSIPTHMDGFCPSFIVKSLTA